MSTDSTGTRYPWDKWFSKPKFKLVRGKDFTCMPHSMIVQIRTVASSRGVSTNISTDGDTITVVVRNSQPQAS